MRIVLTGARGLFGRALLAGAPDVLDGLVAAEVRAALARLAALDREVVALRFYEGLTHAEVAQGVGSSAAAVKQRVWRALGSLRALLGSRGAREAAAGEEEGV